MVIAMAAIEELGIVRDIPFEPQRRAAALHRRLATLYVVETQHKNGSRAGE